MRQDHFREVDALTLAAKLEAAAAGERLDGADDDFLSPERASANSALLLLSLPVMVATTPLVR